ncbi:PE domain-containing protein, partial [Mycobacterium tuberculosis]|uniref:PE domain-containing protein n=1 Tax=Mycobacterium tuberculosis TaxID=1773 RepID=UPI001F190744
MLPAPVASAAPALAGLRSALRASSAAAAGPPPAVVSAAAAAVSPALASLFG